MRFPEDKIKEAILHPDLEIRDRATRYFAKSHSHDVSIMAQVMKAVETYGRQDAYRLLGLSRDLPQTAESLAWVIDELNDDQSDTYENYTYNLSMVLVEADPTLLLPKESSILEARHFLPDLRSAFSERLRMCWPVSSNGTENWNKIVIRRDFPGLRGQKQPVLPRISLELDV
jgi:hypothetical protein